MVLRVGDTLEVQPAVGAKEAVQLQQLQAATGAVSPGVGTVSGTVTVDADTPTVRYNYNFSTDITLAIPSGGADAEQIELFFYNNHGAGSTRVITLSALFYGGDDVPTSIAVPDAGIGYVRLRCTNIALGVRRWVVERAYTLNLLSNTLQYLGGTNWVAQNGTSITNQLPEGLRPGDIVYAVVHSREAATALPAIANWAVVYTATSIGGGTVGDSAGPTRVTFLKRVVGAGGLTGTNTFSGLGTTVAGATLHVFRPRYGLTISEAGCFNSRATAAQQINGTTDVIALTAGDFVLTCVGSPDDTANPISVSGLSVASNVATFGPAIRSPDGPFSSTLGNDLSSATFVSKVITGASNVGIAYEGFMDTSETGGIAAIRIRAA